MINKDNLADLCCTAALARSEFEELSGSDDVLRSKYGSYPVIDGIPDLRFPEGREETSYDSVLPEWQEPSPDPELFAQNISRYGMQRNDIKGFKNNDLTEQKNRIGIIFIQRNR